MQDLWKIIEDEQLQKDRTQLLQWVQRLENQLKEQFYRNLDKLHEGYLKEEMKLGTADDFDIDMKRVDEVGNVFKYLKDKI